MNNILGSLKKSKPVRFLRNKFPNAFLYLVIKPSNLFRFTNEKKFFNNTLTHSSNKSSVVLFTTHKCASTYTNKVIHTLLHDEGYTHLDLEAYIAMFEKDRSSIFSSSQVLNSISNSTGFLFAPLRYYSEFQNVEIKKILVLRDPRDVLTSYYFSKLYSHTVINQKFKAEREYYKDHTIDEFVIEMLPDIKKRYQDYINNLLTEKNVLNVPYELLVSDFPQWLNKVVTFLEIDAEDNINSLIRESNFTVKKEDKYSQIRNIQPGNFRKKLNDKTIEILNREFEVILKKLNYQQ